MNLVSYEYVACQDAKRGVLILSEVITIKFDDSFLIYCIGSKLKISQKEDDADPDSNKLKILKLYIIVSVKVSLDSL